mmetsp:Transcript_16212/g.46590  ORF Transcript_16212/g.46590 Transcript_16212/m.46590 type:complete len:101 (-) Transcript_16212:537-839(-)
MEEESRHQAFPIQCRTAAALEFREELFRKSTSADEFHGAGILKADKKSDTSPPVVALPPEQQNQAAPSMLRHAGCVVGMSPRSSRLECSDQQKNSCPTND